MNQEHQNSQPQKNPPPVSADSVSWPDIRTQSELHKAAETQQAGGQVYPNQGQKIGEILKSLGIIDDRILNAVEKRHPTKTTKDKPTGELLIYMGKIEPEVMTRALCIQSGVPMVDVRAINIPYNILKLVANEIAREKQAIPVGVFKETLYLAVADPLNFSEHHFFSFSTGLKVKPVFAPQSQMITCLKSKWTESGSDIWAG